MSAVYSGETGVYASSTGTLAHGVSQVLSTTKVTASPVAGASVPVFGQSVSLTATISDANGGPTTGSVSFYNGTASAANLIGSATLSG